MIPWRAGVYIPLPYYRYPYAGGEPAAAGGGYLYGRYPFGVCPTPGRFPALPPPPSGNVFVVPPSNLVLQPGMPLEGQPLTSNRLQRADPTEELPSMSRPADRTIQIDDFTWTLAPDPGPGGSYPKLAFLIGAAISSSKSGTMTLAEIVRWIREYYPIRKGPCKGSISNVLGKDKDFVSTRTDKHSKAGEWKLRDPKQFACKYSADTTLSRYHKPSPLPPPSSSPSSFPSEWEGCEQLNVVDTETCSFPPEWENPWSPYDQSESPLLYQLASPGTAGESSHTSELLIKIGEHTVVLPPDGAELGRPPFRLLCGCAIALGPEQGSSIHQIASWIAGRYPVWEEGAMEKLLDSVSHTLSAAGSGFRPANTDAPESPVTGSPGSRWVIERPSEFAAGYGERLFRRRPVPAAAQQQYAGQSLTGKERDQPDPAVEPPSTTKAADRTIQIAGVTLTLPPDPGRGGVYPKLTFLIGAAIASSDSGTMGGGEIIKWIRARYPSRPKSTDSSIKSALSKGKNFFMNVGLQSRGCKGLWALREPSHFRKCYERDIMASHSSYKPTYTPISIDNVHRDASPTPRQDPVAASPQTRKETGQASERLVRIGDYDLTLAPYRVGQMRPRTKLLCGCAIACGHKSGSGIGEIVDWIVTRYPSQEKNYRRKMLVNIRALISAPGSGFRRTDILAPRRGGGRPGHRWVLENPSAFAARYADARRRRLPSQ